MRKTAKAREEGFWVSLRKDPTFSLGEAVTRLDEESWARNEVEARRGGGEEGDEEKEEAETESEEDEGSRLVIKSRVDWKKTGCKGTSMVVLPALLNRMGILMNPSRSNTTCLGASMDPSMLELVFPFICISYSCSDASKSSTCTMSLPLRACTLNLAASCDPHGKCRGKEGSKGVRGKEKYTRSKRSRVGERGQHQRLFWLWYIWYSVVEKKGKQQRHSQRPQETVLKNSFAGDY